MRALRENVKGFLGNREYDQVLALADRDRRLVRTVVSLLYDGDELTRWRAVTATGKLAAAAPEMIRPLVGRFIWWMNDESGGIGWMSAPALGEIGRMAPALLEHSVRVVIHYRAERILLPGVIWAIGRLAATYRREAEEAVPDLIGFLSDGDAEVRGHAAWALGEIGGPRGRGKLAELLQDRGRLRIYVDEELTDRETRAISADALEKIPAE